MLSDVTLPDRKAVLKWVMYVYTEEVLSSSQQFGYNFITHIAIA